MFTGIIEELGKIRNITWGNKMAKLTVECSGVLKDTRLGDSIAVNGICLTVTDMGQGWFTADVMPETLRKTNLEKLKTADSVNLERALKLSDRLGGHIVSGHIDGTGIISGRDDEGDALWLEIEAGAEIMKYIVLKGSVALDGTSLTVAHADVKSFKVSLIPLTQTITTLSRKKPGDRINIECDIIGKYVERLLRFGQGNACIGNDIAWRAGTGTGGISEEFLKANGFA